MMMTRHTICIAFLAAIAGAGTLLAACDDTSSTDDDTSMPTDTSDDTGTTADFGDHDTSEDTSARDTSTGDTTLDDTADTSSPADTASDTTSGDVGDTGGDTVVGDMTDTMMPPDTCRPEPFDVGATYDSRIVVATDGSDAGGDGSDAAPYATLERAAQDAAPGTEVVIQTGTYSGSAGFLNNLEGTATAPIKIRGEGGNVILDAEGAGEVLHLVEPRYVVLEGLTLRGSSTNGLNIDDGGTFDTPAEHVVLRNLTLNNVGGGGNHDCIKLSGVDNFFVLDSDLSGCNAGDAIDMVGCHDGVIAGNHIHDTPGGGIQNKGGTADILMTGNRFVDVIGRSINAGGSTGLQFFRPQDATYEAARLRMIGNIFVRPGAESGASVAYVGCDTCVFANNTIIDPQTWIARILQETVDETRFVPSRDGLFVNNIVVFDLGDLRNGTFVNVGPDTAPETFTFANNLWYSTDTPSFDGPTYSGGIPPEMDSIIQQDPMLDSDHRTQPGSPAAGAGRTLTGGLDPDFDGKCFADPPTIGAFEIQ